MADRTFADLEQQTAPRGRGCLSCGEPTDGTLSVQLRKHGPKDQENPLRGGHTVKSLSRSFCESCAVERYLEIEAIIKDRRAGI